MQKTQKLPRNDQPMPIILAGGGTPAGLVYGATDKQGALVTEAQVTPWSVERTMVPHLPTATKVFPSPQTS